MNIVQELLDRALTDSQGGRNKAGLWLACQLRDNLPSQTEAEVVMREFAARVPQNNHRDRYTVNEALSSLRQAYKEQPREPWATGEEEKPKPRRVKPVTDFKREEPKPDPDAMKRLQEYVKGCVAVANSPAAEYLLCRGIPTGLAQGDGIKYAASWGSVGEAVVFPVRDKMGAIVAAQGRSIHEKKFETIGMRSLGVFMTRHSIGKNPVAVTEAPIDALTLELCGLSSMALCGSSGLPHWLKCEFGKTTIVDGIPRGRVVFLATDNDDTGDASAKKLEAEIASTGARCIRLVSPLKDWNECLLERGWLKTWELIDFAFADTGIGLSHPPDPRAELLGDSGLWIRLLRLAEPNEQLHGILHGFRSYGAQLSVDTTTAIIGRHETHCGWKNKEEFDAEYEKYLGPHKETLSILLGQLA